MLSVKSYILFSLTQWMALVHPSVRFFSLRVSRRRIWKAISIVLYRGEHFLCKLLVVEGYIIHLYRKLYICEYDN